ncbi:hypothetical protein [Scytonema sp. NUACC26]
MLNNSTRMRQVGDRNGYWSLIGLTNPSTPVERMSHTDSLYL